MCNVCEETRRYQRIHRDDAIRQVKCDTARLIEFELALVKGAIVSAKKGKTAVSITLLGEIEANLTRLTDDLYRSVKL